MLEFDKPADYSQYAYNELCEFEVYGKFNFELYENNLNKSIVM